MAFDRFHPIVAEWFAERFGAPTPAQAGGWPAIASGRDTLIAAPTGSGKTLAGFLWAVNALLVRGLDGRTPPGAGGPPVLPDETAVVYVSPLKALGNDVHANLIGPLAEIRERAAAAGVDLPEIRLAVRSGDTPAAERARMSRRPPHILITTPESLYILLTADGSRAYLKHARTVIVDEIHAVAQDKRGAHLTFSLERLDRLAGRRLQRIGLSATQKPVEEIARLLTGAGGDGACAIVDVGHRRPWDLSIEVPGPPRGPIVANDVRDAIYDRLAALARQHRTTLVFVNTRRLAERVAHQLGQRLGETQVAAHHGSLSRRLRLDAERRLKTGELRVVVATASLELGIDIGHVDLVCHLGAPSSIAVLLQRVGRAGHTVGGVSRGILLPFTRDELLQCAAAVRAARAGDLDTVVLPEKPLDVLAQQLVAAAAAEEIAEDELYALVRRAHAYRGLTRPEFDQVVEMLAEGVARRWGRAAAYLHRDATRGTVRGRRGARLAAITSGGAIPDTADYDVIHDPEGVLVGRVNEDFAIESMTGDVFLLGNTSWRIRRVESGRVRVEDAHGAPPSVPFWLGESPGRSRELSAAVSALRRGIADRLEDTDAARQWLAAETGLDLEGAAQAVQYLAETRAALGGVPTQDWIVAERFFDEAGGMQLILHTPFGARINRAWGFALRKRFCLTFDFELQAAATDDGIVLSLGPQHSFPLESVFHFVRPATLRDDIIQAVLASPLFTTRWRWNAARSLAVPRYQGGRRVPMPIQRMRAEDLLAAVFPGQVACQDNHAGPIIPPDHPLVNETIGNCLDEAMDTAGLASVLADLERGLIRAAAVETPAPSPMSHEILNANPYAFLDDAPLEERRARAVALRHVDRAAADGPGVLDATAIADVAAQAWPDVRGADDLHDFLLTVRLLPLEEAAAWDAPAHALVAERRTVIAVWQDAEGRERRAYVATDRTGEVARALGDVRWEPAPPPVPRSAGSGPEPSEAAQLIVHGWVQCVGPFTAAGLATRLGLSRGSVESALAALEGGGAVLRGRFTPGTHEEEWCDRRLLARIHRLTLGRLRREIDAVAPAVFMRFLLRWQHLQPGTQLHGRDGVAEIVGMLQGLEVPAPAWDEHVLSGRIRLYNPDDLNVLCLNGLITWGRLTVERAEAADGAGSGGAGSGRAGGNRSRHGRGSGPVRRGSAAMSRSAPIALLLRDDLGAFVAADGGEDAGASLRGAAADVFRHLSERGASFLGDIARGTGRLPAETESALWELVARGLVSGDGFAGLRQLIDRSDTNRRRRFLHINGPRPQGSRPPRRVLPAGRWAVWRPGDAALAPEERDAIVARQLLRRYGIVFRDLLARERAVPPWRRLLDLYRRWEAQGQVRGGRFVAGVAGEQYALPGAVEALRAVRREPDETVDVVISAADPLNLAGVLLPGDRISPLSGLAIVLRNGVIVETGPYGAVLAGRRALAEPSRAGAAVPGR
ncbi:MAG TPA: DEAD/DEAH box helicase [bacterium]|nr:DEAD/DEAH box helicase [bacterium]